MFHKKLDPLLFHHILLEIFKQFVAVKAKTSSLGSLLAPRKSFDILALYKSDYYYYYYYYITKGPDFKKMKHSVCQTTNYLHKTCRVKVTLNCRKKTVSYSKNKHAYHRLIIEWKSLHRSHGICGTVNVFKDDKCLALCFQSLPCNDI